MRSGCSCEIRRNRLSGGQVIALRLSRYNTDYRRESAEGAPACTSELEFEFHNDDGRDGPAVEMRWVELPLAHGGHGLIVEAVSRVE